MADNAVGILFEVLGKGSIDGESGKLISEQLKNIAKEISERGDLQVKFSIDAKYFSEQLKGLKLAIQSELGIIEGLKPRNTDGGSSDSTQKESDAQKELYKQIEKVATLQERLNKAKVGSVTQLKGNRELQEQETILKKMYDQYIKINGAESETLKIAKEYEESLRKAAQSQPASLISQEKIKNKAASLYTDNGFDKIIARTKEARQIVDDFNAEVDQVLNKDGGATVEEVNDLNTKFIETQTRLKEIGRETDTVGNKIKEAFGNKIIQRVAYAAMMLIVRQLREIYTNVVKIDTAMTQLRIVTQASTKDFEKFSNAIAKSAKNIGSSVTELIDSTTVYARLGYTLTEAATLAEKTTAYSKVADLKVGEATTNITAIIKAYDIQAKDLESVLDQVIYVGNHYAISSAEIGTAMNNAASALKANGNTLQQAIGIVAAANVTLQNVDRSSTAVRTIAARISRSKAELEELGEDIGSVMATSELDTKMRAFGVAITDANGGLRSTYAILGDLSKQWDNLTTTEHAAIAEMLAGTRQQNAFYSIMQNWSDAEQIVSGAADAVGSYQTAVETYTDSIEGRVNSLKATWEEFSTQILDSALIKFLVSFTKTLINILSVGNGVLPKFAIITAATFALIAALKVLTKNLSDTVMKFREAAIASDGAALAFVNGSEKILASAGKFLANNAPMILISAFLTIMSVVEDKWGGFVEVIVGGLFTIGAVVATVLSIINGEMLAFMASNPIGWILAAITAVVLAIKGAVDLIDAYNPSFETLKDAAKDSIDAWKKTEEELKNVNEKLEEVQKRIDELKQKGTNLTLVDSQELSKLEQVKANLEAQQKIAEEEERRAKQKAADDASAALNKYNNTSTKQRSTLVKVLTLGISYAVEKNADTQEQRFDKILKDYQNASEADKDFITSTLNEYRELLKDFDFGDSENTDQYLRQYYSILDRYNLQTGNAATTWNRVLADTRFSSEVKKLQELANSQGVSMDAIAASAPNFLNYLKEIGLYVDNDTSSSNALVESIRNLRQKLQEKTKINFTDDIDVMQDKFESLSNALKDINSNGVISMDNISKILDANAEGYPTLLKKYFSFIDGVGYTLRDDLKGKSMSDILKLMAEDELGQYAKELEDARKLLSGMTSDNEDYATAVKNVATLQENLNTRTAEWATILREQAIEDETEKLEKLQDGLEKQLDQYKDLIEIRKDLLNTYKKEIDYQKQLEQKQKKVSSLQTELNLARLDNSASGQARARELQKQVEEAQDELDDFTLEQAIEMITSNLDSQYDEYERFIKSQIESIKETIVGLTDSLKILLTPNTNNVQSTSESIQSGGKTYTADFEGAKQYILDKGMRQGDKNRWGQDPVFREIWNKLSAEEQSKLKGYTDGEAIYDTNGRFMGYRKVAPVYHTGGFVGDLTSLKSNEEFAKLMKGEYVSTPSQMDSFMKKVLPSLVIKTQGGGATINNNSPLIEIKCGDIDKDSLPKLKALVDQAVEQIEKDMESALSRTGYKKKY